MPDYNPDKEGHRPHEFIVQRAWPDRPGLHVEEVKSSKGVLKFNEEGRMVIKDAALAREVQSEYPAELAVTRVQSRGSERGHRYHFGQMPRMPWHKYDADGNRIKDEPKEADHED